MRTVTVIVFIALSALFAMEAYGQVAYGVISESGNGLPLPGATIRIPAEGKGTVADIEGKFRLTLSPGKHIVEIDFVGYQSKSREVELLAGDSLDLSTALQPTTLQVVEIDALREAHLGSAQMGSTQLEMDLVETLPAFLGEVDLLKTLQLLPGVQAAGEGNAAFYVRGGGPDQNLILFDGAPVYNASHLLGFFSVFNSDAIEDVTLFKGGMPANYGERLASVIDIRQRQGDKNEFKTKGGIGLISSRATLEGPIQKEKSSFLVSGRRTYVDILARPFINEDSPFGGSRYFFYDFNARLDFTLNDESSLSISGYYGDDAFGFSSPSTEFSTDVEWGNRIISANWLKRIGQRSLIKVNTAYTNYRFEFRGGQDEFELRVKSDIRDYRIQPDITWYIGGHRINTGVQYTFHDLRPNNSSARQGETIFDLGQQQQFFSHEGALWIADEFDIGERIRVEAGLRLSGFEHTGPFTRYLLDEQSNVRDSLRYERNERVRRYHGWEPRLQVRYKWNEKVAIKASFTQNYQYIHLANVSPLALPTDVWLPSTDLVQPQIGRQWALGYFRTSANAAIEASAEIFHKDMRNLIEYVENYQPQDAVGNNEDNFLTFGRGYATGIELFLRKVKGNTTGWIGYTLSRTRRQFDDINDGRWYLAPFDRTHDLALVLAHTLNDRWTLSSNFVYGTGRPITLPETGYFIENRLVLEYGERNSIRMVDFHRLDVAATLTPRFNVKTVVDAITGERVETPRRIQSKWVFSIYNVYSRLNPYFYYIAEEGRIEENSLDISVKQVSLFPILPSVTWNFSF